MTSTTKRVGAAIAATAAAFALGLGGASVAQAKITPIDVSCTNGGGHQAPGQQTTCTGGGNGGGQTQDTENQNPAGHAPPGQN